MTENRLSGQLLFLYSDMCKLAKKKMARKGFPNYIRTVSSVSSLFNRIAEVNDFEEGLRSIKISQTFDLENFAQTASDKKNIQTDITNIQMAEKHFLCLRDYPEIYKTHLAPGFIPRDRRENGLIPNDGMQKALASHLKHVAARNSLMLEEAEKNLILARTNLTQQLIQIYTSQQRALLKPTELVDSPRQGNLP